jgi:hypothetical protein
MLTAKWSQRDVEMTVIVLTAGTVEKASVSYDDSWNVPPKDHFTRYFFIVFNFRYDLP